MKKRLDEINARGWAGGWHAEQLAHKAKALGVTMSSLHLEHTREASAFNVPARATKVTSQFVYYELSDGSTVQHVNQNHGRK